MHPISSLSVLSLRGPPCGAGSGLEPTIASLSGELDISTLPDLCKKLAALIAFGDADLILDLCDVDFLDASAAGVLVRAEEFLTARSRSLVLRSPPACALSVFDLCGLSDLVEPDGRGP
ncbi:MAG TPA: STAS domain-containing protein [Acidimicrobiales bacterium]|nr:STAS domain-containing protein [Acidimicrobiales bacterium]